MNTQVAVLPTRHSIVTYSDMQSMAQAMAESGFFGFKTPQQALAVMLIAQANGQHPATAAQDYDVIQNKPAKKPQAMLRDFLACGGKVEWIESTDKAAEATFSHPQGGSIKVRWDMARANQMGLGGKDNYKKQPGVMFRWRCVSEGVRIIYPSATGGMHTPDEIADIQESRATVAVVEEPIKAVESVKPALPDCSTEKFNENLPKWEAIVASGKTTPAQIISKLETKTTLSADQKQLILEIKGATP